MAHTDFKSVDQYIATFPEDVQAILQRVRRTIRKAVPTADEVISYQRPTSKLPGARVIYFAGWKDRFSVYPATDLLVKAFKEEFAPYRVSKGTIRFPLSKPVPVTLIERLAKLRAEEAAKLTKAKPPPARKTARRTPARS